jgi:hypothetical protein
LGGKSRRQTMASYSLMPRVFYGTPDGFAVLAEILPVTGGGGLLAGCGKHTNSAGGYCDVMRAQRRRRRPSGDKGQACRSEWLGWWCGVVWGSLGAPSGTCRPPGCGLQAICWHVNMESFTTASGACASTTTASTTTPRAAFSAASPHHRTPVTADQTHMDHVCWACDCLSGTAVPVHPQAVAVAAPVQGAAAQAIRGPLHAIACTTALNNNNNKITKT